MYTTKTIKRNLIKKKNKKKYETKDWYTKNNEQPNKNKNFPANFL